MSSFLRKSSYNCFVKAKLVKLSLKFQTGCHMITSTWKIPENKWKIYWCLPLSRLPFLCSQRVVSVTRHCWTSRRRPSCPRSSNSLGPQQHRQTTWQRKASRLDQSNISLHIYSNIQQIFNPLRVNDALRHSPAGANDALRHSPAGGEWCLEAFPSGGRMMPWGIPQRGANDALRHSPAGGEWCLEAFPSGGRMMPWGIPQRGANDALRHSPAGGEWCLEAFPSGGRMMPWGIPQRGANDALRHHFNIFFKWTNEINYSTKVYNFSQYEWLWINLLKLDPQKCVYPWKPKKSAYHTWRPTL